MKPARGGSIPARQTKLILPPWAASSHFFSVVMTSELPKTLSMVGAVKSVRCSDSCCCMSPRLDDGTAGRAGHGEFLGLHHLADFAEGVMLVARLLARGVAPIADVPVALAAPGAIAGALRIENHMRAAVAAAGGGVLRELAAARHRRVKPHLERQLLGNAGRGAVIHHQIAVVGNLACGHVFWFV